MQSQSFSIGEIEAFASKFYAGRSLLLTPYGYNLTFSSLAAGATATQTLNIAANADFIALVVHHRANVAAAAQNVSTKSAPLVRMLVTDSGSNEQLGGGPRKLQHEWQHHQHAALSPHHFGSVNADGDAFQLRGIANAERGRFL
jgi:hypothetical protein